MPTSAAGSGTSTPTVAPITNDDFETALTKEGFPESYKVYLRMLHGLYPQWVFKAYNTNLDWNTVISSESKAGVNLIPNSKGLEWLSMEGSAYDWKTDKFTVYDGTYWVTASNAAIQYYMDPRNFLTTNGIFQFELLKYQSTYQNIAGVNNILSSTPFYSTFSFTNILGIPRTYSYADTFIKAALYSGVSPYHLASRSKQEVMSSTTAFSGSASGTYSGYEGYYNFYNIGATNTAGGGATANGLSYAKNGTTSAESNSQYMLPWNNQFKAITGGAFWIGSRYINRGQDTVYLQKFNVTPISIYSHQYMGNVEAPYAEAKKVKVAYSSVLNTPIVFSIPVYSNMPVAPVAIPTPILNPNNWIKTLNVSKADGTALILTPSFDQTVKNYDIVVANNVDKINVAATAVNAKAKVAGTGTRALNVGTNKIDFTITAENGAVATYTITVVRK
jgi:Beta- N-acetylglucosaminidase